MQVSEDQIKIFDFCIDKCVVNLRSKTTSKQEACMENCLRKSLSALDFLDQFENTNQTN